MTTKASLLDAGNLKDTAPEKFDVTFKTTAGDFVVQVTRAWAPLGADRFYNLVNHGFYDDAAFFSRDSRIRRAIRAEPRPGRK
jgi:peptidyl-prolyl cis-trans isomerase A (cyclophilin A)